MVYWVAKFRHTRHHLCCKNKKLFLIWVQDFSNINKYFLQYFKILGNIIPLCFVNSAEWLNSISSSQFHEKAMTQHPLIKWYHQDWVWNYRWLEDIDWNVRIRQRAGGQVCSFGWPGCCSCTTSEPSAGSTLLVSSTASCNDRKRA